MGVIEKLKIEWELMLLKYGESRWGGYRIDAEEYKSRLSKAKDKEGFKEAVRERGYL